MKDVSIMLTLACIQKMLFTHIQQCFPCVKNKHHFTLAALCTGSKATPKSKITLFHEQVLVSSCACCWGVEMTIKGECLSVFTICISRCFYKKIYNLSQASAGSKLL
jgi:hypothetical protein